MDKPIKYPVKRDHLDIEVHPLPRGMRSIHEKYGLWICGYGLGGRSSARRHTHPSRYFEFYCLSHLIDGKGLMVADNGKLTTYSPGEAAMVTPGFVHLYGGDDSFYVEDSICFIGPVADRLFAAGVIRNDVVDVGTTRKLLPIIEMAIDPADDSQLAANIALQKLLVDIHLEGKKANPREKRAKLESLIETIHDQPGKWWTVSEMAEFCNVSAPQLRREFRGHTGMSPKTYLDQFKMRKAIELLSDERSSVTEVAEKLGYLDPFHFSRRFKRVTGFSPTNYRANVIGSH